MSIPVTFIPAKKRRRRTRRLVVPAQAQPLVLVAVGYSEGEWVRLTFDRAIDIDTLVAAGLVVDDAAWVLQTLRGSGTGTLLDPQTVEIPLTLDGPATGSGIRMTATGGIGITSADGTPWAGVSGVEIPFG